jgi:hypothetical protein
VSRASPKPRGSSKGAIAQLGERLHGMQEVGGSIPPGSTSLRSLRELSPQGEGRLARFASFGWAGHNVAYRGEASEANPIAAKTPLGEPTL